MLPVSWNDDPKTADFVQHTVDNQKLLRELGVFVYSLGDEGVTLGCSVDPGDLAAYRRWLQGQYATIDTLNASWGTTYKSFDEVDLLDHKDNLEAASILHNFPRWCDRQLFARFNLMQFAGRYGQDYSKLDPQALTGFEGTGGFGDDYDAICGINGFSPGARRREISATTSSARSTPSTASTRTGWATRRPATLSPTRPGGWSPRA